MSKVLYIKANPKSDEASRTFKISERFIESYKQSHPGDDIKTLDLYLEDIHLLTTEDINSIFGEKSKADVEHPILRYAYEFLAADKYIIAAPLWNLSIPAILKAYIDYISVPGITFKYTEQGAVGLCSGKKAIYIAARGGEYSQGPFAPYEMGERYLRTIFGFLGITDFTTISAEKLDVYGENVDAIIEKAISQAQESAKSF